MNTILLASLTVILTGSISNAQSLNQEAISYQAPRLSGSAKSAIEQKFQENFRPAIENCGGEMASIKLDKCFDGNEFGSRPGSRPSAQVFVDVTCPALVAPLKFKFNFEKPMMSCAEIFQDFHVKLLQP